MGVHGIARDLAAAGLGTLKPVDVPVIAGDFPCPIEIRTDDPEGCPAFYGRVVRGVRNGPSPDWLQRRLKAVGQRPISALVDMTNYIMLSYGRPLHVYDLAKLDGAIVARRAARRRGGARAQRQDLSARPDDDGDRRRQRRSTISAGSWAASIRASPRRPPTSSSNAPISIPSISRSPARSSASSPTRAAASSAASIPPSSRPGLQLATRDGDRACRRRALADRPRRHAAGARASTSTTIRRAAPGSPASPCRRTGRQEILQRLGFAVDPRRSLADRGAVMASRRGRRGRHRRGSGPDRGDRQVPSTPLPRAPGVARPTATAEQLIERQARRAAAARGLNEAVTWSFISEAEAAPFGGSAWILANPISEEMKAMRPSLLPGLLAAAARNVARGARERSRLFEIGRRYLERRRAADAWAWSSPARAGRATGGAARPARLDAFDAKAEALAILAAAGAPVDNLQVLGERARRLSSRPVGPALPRAEERARRVRRAPSRILEGVRPRRAGRRGRDLPRRDPAAGAAASAICAAPMRRRRCRR